MLYRPISYLGFLFSSTDQHGVHSPFVYNYVTKCLYQKELSQGSKVKDILLKSMRYFSSENVLFDGMDVEVQEMIKKKIPSLKPNRVPYDFIYIDKLNERNVSTYIIGNKNIHNDTVVFINNIHKNNNLEMQWGILKNNEKIRVTIDLFYCGLIFFRKEQAKEHFKIRV
jgi:hypothetical protein